MAGAHQVFMEPWSQTCYWRIVRRSFAFLFVAGISLGLGAVALGGCSSHPHRQKSYDRSFTDDDRDPTYKADPERADEEVKEQ
jgi:hypothetical protein